MGMKNDSLNGKRVLVIGFGRQGKALARWLPTIGARVTVNDKATSEELGINPKEYVNVKFVLGGHPESLLERVDLICVSGGADIEIPLLKLAKEREIPLTNDAQLFMERCPAPVIGITGSAGKTTTTTLVGEIIRNAGYKTWIGGNIGDVLLDHLGEIKEEDVVVMELSSFQLELMTVSPQVAAITNVTPNHLDRHKTMEAYAAAKANILLHQKASDIAILPEDDPVGKALEILVKGDLVSFSARGMVADGAFVAGNRLILAGSASYDAMPHVLCQKEEIPLRGDHNVLNVLAACAITGALGLATDRPGIDTEIMRQTILNFKPVPHRLEVVREVNGVTYINDSIATAPERLLAALKSFSEPLILLLGGADKDLPWEQAVHLALQKSRHVILFGKTGDKQVGDKAHKIFKLMGADERFVSRVSNLDEALQRAVELAQTGDIVLLSPGGTSYDAYKDFAERGEHFRRLVQAL